MPLDRPDAARSSAATVSRVLPQERRDAVRRDGTFIERAGVRYRMVQVGPQAFYVPGLDPMIGFMRGEERTFSRIHVSSNIDEQWGTREALASQTIR